MSLVFDNPQQLPPVTTEGNGTFGCLVNGKLFLPNAVPGQRTGAYAELQFYRNVVGVNIYVDNFAGHQALVLFLYNPSALRAGQRYDLRDPDFFVQYIDFRKPPSCTYCAVLTGSITIERCDIAGRGSKILSATFGFTASSVECLENVEVTEGRFDIGDFVG